MIIKSQHVNLVLKIYDQGPDQIRNRAHTTITGGWRELRDAWLAHRAKHHRTPQAYRLMYKHYVLAQEPMTKRNLRPVPPLDDVFTDFETKKGHDHTTLTDWWRREGRVRPAQPRVKGRRRSRPPQSDVL